MISSIEAATGDCCYFFTRYDKKPKYGTITRTFPGESSVEVVEALDGKYHVVWENNAAWDEKELKGQIWQKPHNYIRIDYMEQSNEKKPSERISDVCNGKKKRVKRAGTKRKS